MNLHEEMQRCQQPQHAVQENGHQHQGQQKGQQQQQHGKKRPKAGLLLTRSPEQKLVAQLNRQRQVYLRLQEEGAKLRASEATLLRSVAQQSVMLHTLGTVLAQEVTASLEDDEQHTAALRALLADVDAHRLLQQLGGGSVPAALQQQYAVLFTARMLGAAVTPASVAAIRAASTEADVVPRLQQLTAELSQLLQLHSGEEPSDGLVEKVREHCRLMQLLQAAAQDKMWRLASLNLETLQEEAPLVSHWQKVAAGLQLRPEQLEQLGAAYQIYNSKRHQLCSELQQCTEQLQPLLGPHPSNSSSVADIGAAPANSAAANSAADDSPSGGIASGDGTACGISSNSSGPAAATAAAASGQLDWLLDLESAEAASSLLQRMEHLIDAMSVIKLYMRNAFVNCLGKVQLAHAVVHSWPYIMNVWVLCAVALGLQDEEGDQ